MKWLLLVAGLQASATPLCRGFLPKNDMSIPVEHDLAKATGITHAQFDEILDRVYNEYSAPIAKLGAQFVIDREWNDATVNAYADRNDTVWLIHMFGGLARHPAITYDGFAAVACHETGHHLGGAPVFSGDDSWASVEGEADYYAMLKCLRRLFEKDDNRKILAGRKLDPLAVSTCKNEERSQQDEELCIRATMAGVSLAQVLASLEGGSVPRLSTPDPRRVTETYEDHPRAQCRLDTYFQASLCRANFHQDMDRSDYRVGACTDTHVYTRGLRPRCWFKP